MVPPARVTGSYLQPLLEAAAARGVAATGAGARRRARRPALDPLPESLAADDYIALLGGRRRTGRRSALRPARGRTRAARHLQRVRPDPAGLPRLRPGPRTDQRYEQLAHDLGRSRLEVDAGDGTAGLAATPGPATFPAPHRHLAESVFAGIRTFGSWLAGRPLAPRAWPSRTTAMPTRAEYERVLGMAPRVRRHRQPGLLRRRPAGDAGAERRRRHVPGAAAACRAPAAGAAARMHG
jgi:hypothetical protein